MTDGKPRDEKHGDILKRKCNQQSLVEFAGREFRKAIFEHAQPAVRDSPTNPRQSASRRSLPRRRARR